jgi:hypothetical protein
MKSGLSLAGDIGRRPFVVWMNEDGLQIALEGSPIRGEFIVRWQTSRQTCVWFRPYDTSFSHDFTRVTDAALLDALSAVVAWWEAC